MLIEMGKANAESLSKADKTHFGADQRDKHGFNKRSATAPLDSLDGGSVLEDDDNVDDAFVDDRGLKTRKSAAGSLQGRNTEQDADLVIKEES